MNWTFYHSKMTYEHLGIIPDMLSENDPRPAHEQLDSGYAHGGGWRPFEGFVLNPEDLSIKYPGDPAFGPLASTKLREELILFYPHSWVGILQPDDFFEISRMD